MTLRVNAVQRFCLHDGPGIRTTVFLQGCPLRCRWCHNPETQPADSDMARQVEAVDLAVELERDARYWRGSGGGVTLSGGEPLAQADAVLELAARLRERGHHVAVDTSGHGDPADVRRLAECVDLWLWDIKTLDVAKHREATGVDPGPGLDNLAWVLANTSTPVVVRIPLIADVNASPEEMGAMAAWLNARPRTVDVELLPGHSHGVRRGARLKVAVDAADVRRAVLALTDAGLSVLNGGGDT